MKPTSFALFALGLLAASLDAQGAEAPVRGSPTATGPARLERPQIPTQTLPAPAPPPEAVAPAPLRDKLRRPVQLPYMGLNGWVDLHAHPMANLAFGGKLIHGGVDVGSMLPADSACQHRVRAGSVAQALGDDRPSHGGWALNFPCGDALRPAVIEGLQKGNAGALVTAGLTAPPRNGFPNFDGYPAWNDITHQKMWWEWIRRARDGGQRVMVALATNNRTLGDAVGPGDFPTSDRESADLQINELKMFVGRHPDFMEVALSADHLRSIVASNRIAVVIGVEIDNIGNLNALPPNMPDMPGIVAREIQRLFDSGVRYIFPVHVVNNLFGGTAVYTPMFNFANLRDTGSFWAVECSAQGDGISWKYIPQPDPVIAIMGAAKLGLDPTRIPPASPACPQQGTGPGHRNSMGLTNLGVFAIKEMMKRGMLIDIDHMSERGIDQVLAIAESVNPAGGGYPLTSGHAGVRGLQGHNAENSRSRAQLVRIARLHGMFGLGSDGAHAYDWSRIYQMTMNIMGYNSDDPALRAAYQNGVIAFGTDLNGVVKGPPPGGTPRVVYDASFPPSGVSGSNKTWDYNRDGVAHYGMLPDFIRDVRTSPRASSSYNAAGQPSNVTGAELVDLHLNRSADYFWHMWEKAEAQRVNVR